MKQRKLQVPERSQREDDEEGWWCRGGDKGMHGGVSIVTAGEVTQGKRNHLSGRNMVKLWSKRCDVLATCFQRKDVGIMVATQFHHVSSGSYSGTTTHRDCLKPLLYTV